MNWRMIIIFTLLRNVKRSYFVAQYNNCFHWIIATVDSIFSYKYIIGDLHHILIVVISLLWLQTISSDYFIN